MIEFASLQGAEPICAGAHGGDVLKVTQKKRQFGLFDHITPCY